MHIKKVTSLSEGRAHTPSFTSILPRGTSSCLTARRCQDPLCTVPRALCQCWKVTSHRPKLPCPLPRQCLSAFQIRLSDSSWEHRLGGLMNNSRKGVNVGTIVTLHSLIVTVLCILRCVASSLVAMEDMDRKCRLHIEKQQQITLV